MKTKVTARKAGRRDGQGEAWYKILVDGRVFTIQDTEATFKALDPDNAIERASYSLRQSGIEI